MGGSAGGITESLNGFLDPLDIAGVRKRDSSEAARRRILEQQRTSFLDANGELKDNVRLSGRDFFGKDRLQNLANFDQTSPIATRLLQQQGFQNRQARNQLNAQGASSLRNTLSTVASRGGLDSGARARLAAANQRNLLGARQGLQSQQINARNQIFADDANRAVSTLGQLAGFDRADQRADLQTRLAELQLNRQADAQTTQALGQIDQAAGKNFLGK